MSKFKAGDVIVVNGQRMTVKSWPADDAGPFTAVYLNAQGGEVWSTLWAGVVNVETEQIAPAAVPELVEESTGPVESTAGEVPVTDDAAAGPEAEDVEAKK